MREHSVTHIGKKHRDTRAGTIRMLRNICELDYRDVFRITFGISSFVSGS
jgi:hypothetical protein